MSGRECYHCKQWVEEGEAHDCWTTTEAALTADLSADLQEAWERLRETAVKLGDQRIYASHESIVFARESCYFFVRPKRTFLELCVFLGHAVKAPQVRRVYRVSKSKLQHTIPVRHRDELEPPITDWLAEAYEFCGTAAAAGSRGAGSGMPGDSSPAARPQPGSAGVRAFSPALNSSGQSPGSSAASGHSDGATLTTLGRARQRQANRRRCRFRSNAA